MRLLVRFLYVSALMWAAVAAPADSYLTETQNWRADYERDLLGPDGPFTLLTRFTIPLGVSTVGRDASNAFVLPVDSAPARVGKVDRQDGRPASFSLDSGVGATVDGKPVEKIKIAKPVTVAVGDMRLIFSVRDGEPRMAVLDRNSRQRKEAKPPIWFPIEPKYRVVADWAPFAEAKEVRIADNNGSSRVWKSPGKASFTLEGQSLELQGVLAPDGKQLSFFFRDQTAGNETYGAGRFLDTDLPKDGKVVVDFNRAYNPYCAVNSLYICPVPPRENHLPLRIPAGERDPHAGVRHQ